MDKFNFNKFNFNKFNFKNIKSGLSIFHIIYGVTKRLFTLSVLAFALIAFMFFGVAIGFFANIISKTEIPTLSTMQTSLGQLSQASTLHYDNGELISEINSDLVRYIVSTDEISPYIKNGLIATEDSYFYQHQGMVPKAVLRATLQELLGSATSSGGSTITQQLVKQQLLTSEYTFTRKAKELILAMRVEKYFSKDEILTAYLNVSPFGRNSNGNNIAGIQAAAQGIFGVDAKDVSIAQAAFLVGLPQSPYTYTPYTSSGNLKENYSSGLKRMQIVLSAMKRDGYISNEEYEQAKNYDISKDFIQSTTTTRPTQSYLYQAIHKQAVIILMKQQIEKDGKKWEDVTNVDELYNQYYQLASEKLANSGYHVYSTINKDVHNAMQQVVQTTLPGLARTYTATYKDNQTGETKTTSEPLQIGNVAIENKTGKVIGFIGGADFSISQMDHAFSTRRSPGSTIKPLLVYGPAIDANLVYPASMLADTAISYLQPDGTYWTPSNASGSVSDTFVSTREALKRSLNNPTIHLYNYVLQQKVNTYDYMSKMGITALPKSEYNNLAASIGGFSTGPTVAEQTSAFSTFATDGEHVSQYIIEKIVDNNNNVIYEHQPEKTRVFTNDTAFIMRSMLRDVVLSGTASGIFNHVNFSLPDFIAKTGTSDNYQDLWFIGSTPEITIGQWIGWDNSYGVKHVFNSSERSASQKLWGAVANAINSVKPNYFAKSNYFSGQPSTVTQQSVLAQTGTLSGSVDFENNITIHLDGNKVTDYFSSNRSPFELSFNFSPGASDEDLLKFWNTIWQSQSPTQETETTQESTQTP